MPGKHRVRRQCQNYQLQRAQFPEIQIRKGTFGLGAFTVKNIAKDRYIGEYIAESVDQDSAALLAPLQKHVKLNYSFGLNDKYTLDAWRVGNETRYLNDPIGNERQGPNCASKMLFVNGVHRIVLYACKPIFANSRR
ncbi:hypothetical protein B0H34DRAFT_467035 [Crassisporium funariophilum]|nr:hypothetical protein B0H34DRAFT_467035 [Crassisporium funariophilum]